MSLRMTPEIRFMKDEFIQKGEQVSHHLAAQLFHHFPAHLAMQQPTMEEAEQSFVRTLMSQCSYCTVVLIQIMKLGPFTSAFPRCAGSLAWHEHITSAPRQLHASSSAAPFLCITFSGTVQVMAALDQVRLQREGKISPPPIAISRNVRAAVDRARAQEADEDANVRGGEDNADDDLELLLDDDDEDEDNLQENGGINLDDFFAREKQMAMAQQQPQQRPARSRRR